MNLDELLAYNPQKKGGTKRAREEENREQLSSIKAPRQRLKDGAVGPSQQPQVPAMPSLLHPPKEDSARQVDVAGGFNGVSDEDKLRLLQEMDDDDDIDKEDLDAGAVKRMLLSFEKKVLRNQEMRVKFPDMPEKFMASELELNDEIQCLHVIATVPEHYPILADTHALQTMLGLINHDNSDISITMIDLLQELTDEGEGEGEELEGLVDVLLKEGVVAMLVQNLERLDEKVKEDFDGVHNTLAIIENMCEIRDSEVCAAGGQQGLLAWLLRRVRVRQFDNNKLYSSEILAILLQGGGEEGGQGNRQLLGECDGIDILLQSLAYYKKRDPTSPSEIELMENLFDCLCSALMFAPNRERFLKGEGLQLMILMLKGKKLSRLSALKVLDHAMCNKEGKDNCVKFVEVYGLRSVFPAFMKTPKKATKVGVGEKEHEEHVCSIIVSLFKHLQGSHYDRLTGKFVENDCEKVDRLMELHYKYQRWLKDLDQQPHPEEEDEIDVYLRRLDTGLLALQMVDFIIAKLCTSAESSISSRIKVLMNQHKDSLGSVREVLLEQAANIAGGSEDDAAPDGKNGTTEESAKDDDKSVLTELAQSLQV